MEIGRIGKSTKERKTLRGGKGGRYPFSQETDRPRSRPIGQDSGSSGGKGASEVAGPLPVPRDVRGRPRDFLPKKFGEKAHPFETTTDSLPFRKGTPQGGSGEENAITPVEGAGRSTKERQGRLPVLHEKVQDHLPDSGLKVEAALLHLEPEGL